MNIILSSIFIYALFYAPYQVTLLTETAEIGDKSLNAIQQKVSKIIFEVEWIDRPLNGVMITAYTIKENTFDEPEIELQIGFTNEDGTYTLDLGLRTNFKVVIKLEYNATFTIGGTERYRHWVIATFDSLSFTSFRYRIHLSPKIWP